MVWYSPMITCHILAHHSLGKHCSSLHWVWAQFITRTAICHLPGHNQMVPSVLTRASVGTLPTKVAFGCCMVSERKKMSYALTGNWHNLTPNICSAYKGKHSGRFLNMPSIWIFSYCKRLKQILTNCMFLSFGTNFSKGKVFPNISWAHLYFFPFSYIYLW